MKASKSTKKKQLHGRRSTRKQKLEIRSGNKSLQSLDFDNISATELTSESLDQLDTVNHCESTEKETLLTQPIDTSSKGE
jgi:hypothetical protein